MNRHTLLTRERTWVLVFAICLVLLTAVPYLIAASQNNGAFTGFLIGVEDGNSYIAKMLAGAQGDWLFRSPYTATDQGGALIYQPYLLLGKLLGPNAEHGDLILLFHLFRSGSIVVLCFAIHDFLAHFIQQEKFRRLGLVLITIGTGLGWVLLFVGVPNLLGSIPLDFYSPEAFGFLAIFSLPHLVLARALLLWGLLGYWRVAEGRDKTRILPLILLWLALALTHLITAALGILLIGVNFALIFIQYHFKKTKQNNLWQNLHSIFWPVIGVAPILAFNLWVFWQDAYLSTWAGQNEIRSPNPIHYLVAYGLMLPMAYFGIRFLLRNNWLRGNFFLTWLILLPVLLYAPIGLQRRLSEAAWVMLTVLALVAFDAAKEKGARKTRNPRELWLFALAFPSTLILFLGSLQAAQNVVPPVFRVRNEEKAFIELRKLTSPGDVVLGSYETGNALPAWVPVRVVAGHGPESVNLESLMPRIQAIYQGRTPNDTRLEFFKRYGIDYVFWGPTEQALGSWQPSEEDYLELVVGVGEYKVFAVSQESIR